MIGKLYHRDINICFLKYVALHDTLLEGGGDFRKSSYGIDIIVPFNELVKDCSNKG